MNQNHLSSLLGVCFLLGLASGCQQTTSEANASETPVAAKPPEPTQTVLLIEREDSDMQGAIRQARREVDDFLISLLQPKSNQADFAVKAAFAEGDQIEHMWMVDLSFEQGLLLGKLANDPQFVSGFEKGGHYAVTPEEITDWYYFEDEEMIGGYTVKLLVERGAH